MMQLEATVGQEVKPSSLARSALSCKSCDEGAGLTFPFRRGFDLFDAVKNGVACLVRAVPHEFEVSPHRCPGQPKNAAENSELWETIKSLASHSRSSSLAGSFGRPCSLKLYASVRLDKLLCHDTGELAPEAAQLVQDGGGFSIDANEESLFWRLGWRKGGGGPFGVDFHEPVFPS